MRYIIADTGILSAQVVDNENTIAGSWLPLAHCFAVGTNGNLIGKCNGEYPLSPLHSH